jgi:hypothetical protein
MTEEINNLLQQKTPPKQQQQQRQKQQQQQQQQQYQPQQQQQPQLSSGLNNLNSDQLPDLNNLSNLDVNPGTKGMQHD